MQIRRVFAVIGATVVAACGTTPAPSVTLTPAATPAATTTPTAVPSATAASSRSATCVLELVAGSAPLPAGTYTHSTFRPRVVFTIEDGWVAGTVSPGFFDVQQDRGSPDVVAVQFARVDGIVGASGSAGAPASAAAAAEA